MNLEKDIVALLRKVKGSRLPAIEIANALAIDAGQYGDRSQEFLNLIRVLCKLVEYHKVSIALPTPELPECVYWIEPPREVAR